MTWVFLTDKEREKIAFDTRPYIMNGMEPHEAEVRKRNHRKDWKGLTEKERRKIIDSTPTPFPMKDLYAIVEDELRKKNT